MGNLEFIIEILNHVHIISNMLMIKFRFIIHHVFLSFDICFYLGHW